MEVYDEIPVNPEKERRIYQLFDFIERMVDGIFFSGIGPDKGIPFHNKKATDG